MADSVGVPCSRPWLVVPEAGTRVDGTQAVTAWPMGARPVGRGGSAAVADIAVAVADMAAAVGHSVVGAADRLVGPGIALALGAGRVDCVVAFRGLRDPPGSGVGWGCRGSKEHDVLLYFRHMFLELLILYRHVGELSIEVAIRGGELFECGAICSRGGSKILGSGCETLFIGWVLLCGICMVVSGIASRGGHGVL